MPIVREVYGYLLHSSQGLEAKKSAMCPYTGSLCDGGGNRDMARLLFRDDPGIRSRFNSNVIEQGSIACAICSIESKAGNWIICPRRLLNFTEGQFAAGHSRLLGTVCRTAGFQSKSEIAVWKEITLDATNKDKKFKYRLDYVLREKLSNNSYGYPVIVEIMTCSTSGGNRGKGTDISTAFRKALLSDQGDKVECPNVNVRQVWSRMAGQMIVKSQAANQWGGKAIWVIQDLLAKYISANTGLDLDKFKSSQANEVNIITTNGNDLDEGELFSGLISANTEEPTFSDVLKAAFIPSLEKVSSKFNHNPDGIFIAP